MPNTEADTDFDDGTTTTQKVRQIAAQLAALNRAFRRIIDLDETDVIDKQLLVLFRDAIAYAVKMKGREAETEELLQWVRNQKSDVQRRKASWWGHMRLTAVGITSALATALATRWLVGH